MKAGAVLGLVAVAAGVGVLIAYASSSSSSNGPANLPPVSPALRPPMLAGRRYMVTFTLPQGMGTDEAKALLNFVESWGDMLQPPLFAPDAQGKTTAVVSAETLRALPNGPPSIPARQGALTPYVWAELPGANA